MQVFTQNGNSTFARVCLSSQSWQCTSFSGQISATVASGTFQLGDFNGDGRADIALYAIHEPTNAVVVCYTNANATGFSSCRSTTDSGSSMVANAHNHSEPAFAIDLNGDGRNDLLFYDGNQSWHAYLATATGFSPSQTVITTITGAAGDFVQRQVVAGDFDGDGRVDLLFRIGTNDPIPSPQWKVCFSRFGNAAGQTFDCEDAVWVDGPEKSVANVVVADFNGDGLADIASPTDPDVDTNGGLTQHWRVCLSVGDGSFACNVVDSVNAQADGNDRYALGDFNGDGRTDMVRHIPGQSSSQWQYCYSSGASPSPAVNGIGNVAVSFRCEIIDGGPANIDAGAVFFGDFLGEGRTDLAWNGTIYSPRDAASTTTQRD